ncbi:MAG: PQQ-binding-like beta-propeller repeat protein [Planctomycetaceae bacterium]|nr:PQQ-binding-like beta-propeller repeat protein [Planctomycetaceae bacterium]
MSQIPFLRWSLCLLCLIVGTGFEQGIAGDSWAQFRGPTGQGIALDSKVPVEFSETKNVTWKTEIPGKGWSSPVIHEGQLWVTTAVASDPFGAVLSLQAIGVDLSSGRLQHQVELFRLPSPIKIHEDNSYASPTPVVDAEAVYCHFGTFGTAAISRKTGKVLWKNDELKIEHQGGPGSSLIQYKDFLIVTCDGADFQYVAALDKKTGNIAWKQERTAPLRENPITHRSFATPLIWKQPAGDLLISPGADQVHAYDPLTGKEHWHVRYTGFSNVPAPVSDEKQVYVCTGFFEPILAAIRPGGTGDVTQSHVNWSYNRSVTTVPSPIIVNGQIFTVNEGGILTCLDCQTGKVVRKRRFVGKYSASPVLVNGLLYFCSEEGKVTVLEPNDKLDIVKVNRLLGSIKASPAVVGNALYIRSDSHLYRIEETVKESESDDQN